MEDWEDYRGTTISKRAKHYLAEAADAPSVKTGGGFVFCRLPRVAISGLVHRDRPWRLCAAGAVRSFRPMPRLRNSSACWATGNLGFRRKKSPLSSMICCPYRPGSERTGTRERTGTGSAEDGGACPGFNGLLADVADIRRFGGRLCRPTLEGLRPSSTPLP